MAFLILFSLCLGKNYNFSAKPKNSPEINSLHWKHSATNSAFDINGIEVDILNWRVAADSRESVQVELLNPIWDFIGWNDNELVLPNIIKINDPVNYRGAPTIYIQVSPWRIIGNQIEALTSGEISISVEPVDFPRIYSHPFLLNDNDYKLSKSSTSETQYLIISPSYLASAAQALADMHADSVEVDFQLNTEVVIVENIATDPTNNDIREYIITKILDNSDLKFLLLFGDEIDIPPLFKEYLDIDGNTQRYPSDDFYTTIDDDNLFSGDPQLASGRIPVNNESDALIVVDKIKQYENSIKQQIKKRIEVNKTSELLKQIATNLTKEQFSDSVNIKNFLSQYPELKLNDGKEGYTIKINSKKFEVDYNQNNYSLASMFFDYVKILNKLYISIQDAEIKLISRKNQLSDKINDKKAEILNQSNTVVRKKLWYEKFRWFITSDGLLAIGGKDATSNDILIKRHTEENDLIFHAEIHGSPFFVLKGGKPDMENSIYEVGQSVISFSKAWKEGLSSIKAYWVNKNQVKLSAPSGMSMGKGSFMIEGKRNYIKNLDVKLAVGIKIENQNMLILSGSPQAIKKNAISGVIIVYDNSKLSDGAKKIKNELYKNLNPKYLPLLKELSIDDIIRAMPSGGIRILDSF